LAIGFAFLGCLAFEHMKEEPNQALEPTRVAVTIPADAGLAPATRVAHL
jgi:hypothetical protein